MLTFSRALRNDCQPLLHPAQLDFSRCLANPAYKHGIAAWLIWKDYGFDDGRRALKWYGMQLALNAAWSWLFFGRHSIGAALAEISLLWVAILFTIFLFCDKNRWAGLLMVPYLLWISFAIALNYAIWQLN